ncbi:MAG: hypothetical protein ACYTAN_12765 [Planctomycetota bacterium]|jgi:hypothetical protein
MPEDDWDMGDAELDEAGDQDDATGGAATPPAEQPITAAERQALDALKETGMAPGEVIARARRDYEQEAYGRKPQDSTPAATAADEGASDDPDAVLTKGEYDKMRAADRQKLKDEARMESLQVQMYNAMQEIVAAETANGLGEDLPAYKCKAIADEVANRLGKNVKILSLPQAEFAKEVRKVAKNVIDEERKLAAGIAGAANTAELDTRLEAQRTAGETGARGGAGKRSAPQGQMAEMKTRAEEPPYGVSENRRWPSDADIEDLHKEEMKEHRANVKAGRA